MTEIDAHRVPCALFSFSEAGILQAVNATLCDWLNYSRQQLQGKSIEFILTMPSRIFYQTHLFPLLSMQGKVTEIFLTLQTSVGQTVPVLLSGEKYADGQSVSYACAGITVYHRKEFEDQLIAARREAQLALHDNTALLQLTADLKTQAERLDQQLALVQQRNSELRQLSRVITHELQEPLRKISVFSGFLSDDQAPAGRRQSAQGRLERATLQMRRVVAGLQQYIWLQEAPVHYTDINWSSLISALKRQLGQQFQEDVLHLSVGSLPKIEADSEQVMVLLNHVLSNAIQFKKENEPVTVTITGTEIQKNQYKVLSERYAYGEFVKLDITDNGTGFDPKYRSEVFGLFTRLHLGQQRGVGLALCKSIAEKHGGTISIDSALEKGTTVTVMLPRKKPAGKASVAV